MKIVVTFFYFFILSCSLLNAAITLPKIFTNNMVLQRDKPLKIWGNAVRGENVTISFNGQKVSTKTGNDGQWLINLKAMNYGGPYDMTLSSRSGSITLKNILIGDVWICSGQSNMEWIIKNTNNAEKEIAESNYPKIRLYTVKKELSFIPQKDLAGGEWLECNSTTVPDFSAVAYFFGRKLNKDLDVPVGLINSSWGGTNIQTWISWDVMSQKEQYKNADLKKLQQELKEVSLRQEQFQQAMQHDKGVEEKWYEPETSLDGWKKITLPELWEKTEIGNVDGIIWFRKEFDIPENSIIGDGTLRLGPIDDMDSTFVNGKFAGSVNEYNADRNYKIETSVLKPGKNNIVIKVKDTGGGGGIYGKPEQLFIEVGGKKIMLAGEWLYKTSVTTGEFGIRDAGPNSFPSQLFNAMIHPIVQYALKGAIWYQGESNAGEAYTYRTLFAELINNWRSKWNDNIPFFWVQLANFMKPVSLPSQSEWAELREAQSMTLNLPQTGQAVIIDIGEANDIHPRNKQDVGYRLALAAEKNAYGKDIVYSGPVYQSMQVDGDKIILSFSNTGSGLWAKDKYGYLKSFAIAGEDQKFVWAKAIIDGDKVVVYNNEVQKPVAVRYAWGDNPDDADLYNREGLPASPFRTDTWKGITERK
jgi:sialate O-acetylesterase